MAANTASTIPMVMAQLAGQASSHTIKTRTLNFPELWQIETYFEIKQPPTPPSQGFLATGPIDPTDPNSKIVAALALGIDWVNYLQYFQFIGYNQVPIPESITGESGGDYAMEAFYVSVYLQIQDSIWESIKNFLGSKELYICGMGLGGPLAQLAALDLNPTHSSPDKSSLGPSPQAQCFTYSVPNVANSEFQTFYNSKVVNTDKELVSNTYWAGETNRLVVDFFPTKPANPVTYTILGNPVSLPNLVLPKTFDVPWKERSGLFYSSTLGAKSVLGPKIPTRFQNLPTGFDQVRAYALAQITVNAYRESQHPGTGVPVANYTLKAVVKSNGSPFAFIYDSVDSVVLAFRGTITWAEFYSITANSFTQQSPIISTGWVHEGISELYNLSTTGANNEGSIFKTAVADALKPLVGTKELFITGHDIGGSLANLAGIDYTLNSSYGLKVTKIYTFGSIGIGDFGFQEVFNQNLGDDCYQIRRIYDQISLAFFGVPVSFNSLGKSLAINGQLEEEEITFHSMEGYATLMNPSNA